MPGKVTKPVEPLPPPRGVQLYHAESSSKRRQSRARGHGQGRSLR